MLLSLALLIGAAAAFTWTERLKLAPAPITRPDFDRHFSPICGCKRASADLGFLLRRPQRLDLSIVDEEGHHVASLGDLVEREAGVVALKWDGRNDAGDIVPDGVYRLRVYLHKDRRTILIPTRINVDTTAPVVRVISPREPISLDLSADSAVAIVYRQNEGARAVLLVDGKPAASEGLHRVGRWTLEWDGTIHGKALLRGVHSLSLVGVDRARNRSQLTSSLTLEVF
jgi:hypothetical protein